MEQDTLYLSFSEIPDASEILFKGEIPGIFVEEAIQFFHGHTPFS